MDDAFDALLATAVVLTATLYALQAAVVQHQPNPTLNGYEQQLASQVLERLQNDPKLPSEINNTMLGTHYSENGTTVELAGGQALLQPPKQLTGVLELCIVGEAAQSCATAIIGGSPRYASCHTDYALADTAIVRVTVCLG